MSYKPGAISQLLSSSGTASSSNDGQTGLSSIFSTESLQKFARVLKPEEIIKATKPPTEALDDAATNKKKKKPKTRNRGPKVEEGAVSELEKIVDAESGESNEQSEVAKEERTIFLGNIPTTETVKSIGKLCKEFGEVESIRLRSVPVAGAKVDDAGNQDLVRKVCTNARKFTDTKGSFNAYVVFKTKAAATASLAANNRLIGMRHLRVDRGNPTLFDPKRSIFIGSLPHYTDEEELRKHLAAALPNGQDDIEGVRLIRDSNTLIGKGIGYVLFKNREAVLKALSLHESTYKKRQLRVTVCGKRTKRTESARRDKEDGDDDEERAKKKQKREEEKEKKKPVEAINASNAMKRINLKSIMTRNKVLVSKKQKKSVPGKKGKRLGGVVKRAMKAEVAGRKMK